MSIHSYSKILLHLIFATNNRESIINKDLKRLLSNYFYNYSKEKNIHLIINSVNSDHCHMLIDLPTSITIEQIVHLYKGSSSHYVNSNNFLKSKFSWGRGYGVFSVSESMRNTVYNYIKNQEEHHRIKTFAEEYESFIKRYGLNYISE